MTIRLFILPTQYDIIDFRLGRRPENILVRDFASEAEVFAYQEGMDAVIDAEDRIENLQVAGARIAYTRRPEDPEAEAEEAEAEFATPAEAEAYGRGIRDAEGCVAPLVIDDSDDRFEQLEEWTAAAGVVAVH